MEDRRPPRRELLAELRAEPGLCATCAWLELLTNRRSVFVRCGKAAEDPSFPRYPALPVIACRGWTAWTPAAEEAGEAEGGAS